MSPDYAHFGTWKKSRYLAKIELCEVWVSETVVISQLSQTLGSDGHFEVLTKSKL